MDGMFHKYVFLFDFTIITLDSVLLDPVSFCIQLADETIIMPIAYQDIASHAPL